MDNDLEIGATGHHTSPLLQLVLLSKLHCSLEFDGSPCRLFHVSPSPVLRSLVSSSRLEDVALDEVYVACVCLHAGREVQSLLLCSCDVLQAFVNCICCWFQGPLATFGVGSRIH